MERKYSRYRFVIAFLICLSAISSCYAQYQLSPMGSALRESYGLTSVEFASVCTAPMIPAVFLSLIAGVIVDKIGAKKVIITGLVLASAGLIMRNFSASYATLYLCMIFPGFAASFLNATNPKIFGEWFPPEQAGIMIGLFQASNAFGQTVAIGTTAMLPSYRTAFVISTVLSVITLILWIIFMKERRGKEQTQEERTHITVKECLGHVLTSRGVILAGVSILCVYGAYTVITTYMTMALESRGTDSVVSGATTSVVSIAKLVGCIVIPVLINKVKNYKYMIFALSLTAAVMTAGAWRLPAGGLLIAALFVLGFCVGGLVPTLISIPIRLPEIQGKYAGTAGGIVATLQLLGAVAVPTYVCAPIAGDNYSLMFLIAGGIMLVVCILVFCLPALQKE